MVNSVGVAELRDEGGLSLNSATPAILSVEMKFCAQDRSETQLERRRLGFALVRFEG